MPYLVSVLQSHKTHVPGFLEAMWQPQSPCACLAFLHTLR